MYVMEMCQTNDKIPYLEKQKTLASKGIQSPEEAVNLVNELFHADRLSEEHVWEISLDSAGNVIAVFDVSHGTVNLSCAGSREIMMRAMLSGAVSFMILHNHPSHSLQPSEDDIRVFRKLKECGDLMEIRLLDFIIIGGNEYCSFDERQIK